MKSINSYLFAILVIISITSCDQNVFFYESLPPGISKLDKIPLAYQGDFICRRSNVHFHVDDFSIVKTMPLEFWTTHDEIYETQECNLEQGTAYLEAFDECLPFFYSSQDSLGFYIDIVDTLFSLSDNTELKLYNEHLFLNHKSVDGYWASTSLSADLNGDIVWECLRLEDDLSSLKDISENLTVIQKSYKDSIFVLEPSLTEFDKMILDPDNFIICEILERITI